MRATLHRDPYRGTLPARRIAATGSRFAAVREAQPVSRHLIWASSVMARFAGRRPLQGFHCGPFLHLYAASRWFVFLLRSLHQQRFSTEKILRQYVTRERHSSWRQTFVERASHVLQQMIREFHMVESQGRPLPALPESLRRSLPRSWSAEQHPLHFEPMGSSFSAQIPGSLNPTIHAQARLRLEQLLSLDSECTVVRVSRRIVRQFRRLEEDSMVRRAGSARRTLSLASAQFPAGQIAPTAVPAMQLPREPAEIAAAAPWSAVAPGLNVMQVTDEIMRQLDRRVIAARERRGKI